MHRISRELRTQLQEFLFGIWNSYGIWVVGFRLLSLTLITYFLISPTARFQDISEAFSSNEVTMMGLSALLYVSFLCWLNPIGATRFDAVFNKDLIEKNFLPGFIRGTLFGGGLILVFVLSGSYLYLGYFIQFEEAPLALTNVLLRTAAVIALAYCEAFIFHEKLAKFLKTALPDHLAAQGVAIVYCLVKILQFDFGVMHLLTLYLLSLSVTYQTQARKTGGFAKGAGFWAAILIVFHPLFSLPIFGNDFSGVLLIRPNQSNSLGRVLTGGVGGPISSLAFQALLILDIGRSILRRKRPTLRERLV